MSNSCATSCPESVDASDDSPRWSPTPSPSGSRRRWPNHSRGQLPPQSQRAQPSTRSAFPARQAQQLTPIIDRRAADVQQFSLYSPTDRGRLSGFTMGQLLDGETAPPTFSFLHPDGNRYYVTEATDQGT